MRIETSINQENIDRLTKNLLTDQQVEEALDLIAESLRDAVKKNLKPEELMERIRDRMSYNQILFFATMYVGNSIVEAIEDVKEQLDKNFGSL